jgi:hypothetical protein
MYHRITRANVDPWALCVDPDNFSQQMEALKKIATPVPLMEIPDADPRHPSVAITFDDGYLDNLEIAEPILASYLSNIFVASFKISPAFGGTIDSIFLHQGPPHGPQLWIPARILQIDPANLEYRTM